MTLKRRTPLRSKRPKKDKPTMGQLINSGVVKKASSLGKRKASGEKEVFAEIWDERPHECQLCGIGIHEATASNFSHLLPKGMYPEHKKNKDNIWIMCHSKGDHVGCHDKWTYWGKSLQDNPKWSKFFTAYWALWDSVWKKQKQ